MTIPLSPAYRMSEEEIKRERERNSRDLRRESEKEGTSERGAAAGYKAQSDDQGGDEEER